MTAHQLPGPVAIPRHNVDTESELLDLRKKNAALQHQVDDLQLDLQKQRNEVKRAHTALSALQTVLGPLHRSLRMVFGEFEAAGVPDFGEYKTYTPGAPAPSPHGPQDTKWQPWIQKFAGTKPAEFIRALLDHGPLTKVQLKSVTRSGSSTVDQTISKLENLGLITKGSDAKWQLKN